MEEFLLLNGAKFMVVMLATALFAGVAYWMIAIYSAVRECSDYLETIVNSINCEEENDKSSN